MFEKLKCRLGYHDVQALKGSEQSQQICGRCGATRTLGCTVGRWQSQGREWIANVYLPSAEMRKVEAYLAGTYEERTEKPRDIFLDFPNGRVGSVSVGYPCSASKPKVFFDLQTEDHWSFSVAESEAPGSRMVIRSDGDEYIAVLQETEGDTVSVIYKEISWS